jgi:hypothetical protein
MKFEFNPKVEITTQEKELLINFSRAVEEACNNATCDGCVLAAVCNQNGGNAVRFLDALFETLGIY